MIWSQVLPGFQFRVQDLYTKPTAQQLVEDPVYNSFISPLYRAERQRADQAEARAEEERQRAEHYAPLLKAAGILPPS